jgi:hypothetical protein
MALLPDVYCRNPEVFQVIPFSLENMDRLHSSLAHTRCKLVADGPGDALNYCLVGVGPPVYLYEDSLVVIYLDSKSVAVHKGGFLKGCTPVPVEEEPKPIKIVNHTQAKDYPFLEQTVCMVGGSRDGKRMDTVISTVTFAVILSNGDTEFYARTGDNGVSYSHSKHGHK